MEQVQNPQAVRPSPGDQLSIATPELVAIDFPLAGLGSRFVAIFLDYLLWVVVGVILVIALIIFFSGSTGASSAASATTTSSTSYKWGEAIGIAIPFLVLWGYFTLFEAFWNGQTPGKRIMKIRVIQKTGRPMNLFESMGRNLVRFVDWLPAFYIIGVISMFATKRQQRLGDLIAGTLVVHERPVERPVESIGSSRTFTSNVFKPVEATRVPRESPLPADAIAKLTLADLQALEQYLARRLDVPLETRAALASRMSDSIAQKMNYAIPVGMNQETFLEEVAYALRSLPDLRR